MKEIQGKSILVRVREGSSYRESTVFTWPVSPRSVLKTSSMTSKPCLRFDKGPQTCSLFFFLNALRLAFAVSPANHCEFRIKRKKLTMAVFILRTHYPSGRTWANVL